MRSGRRRWALLVVLAMLAGATAFSLPALGQGPVTAEVGVLHLHLAGDGDRFVFDPAGSGGNLTQTLSQTKCKLASSGSSLASVVGSGQANKKPFAGLKDHRIGVGQNGEGKGEPCARIDKNLGQKLTVTLAGALQGGAIGYAEIDLGFKFNGDAVLELRRGAVLVDTITVPCKGGSDCGPDSGGSDNERVILWLDPADNPGKGHWQAFQIDGVFDSILIRPGSASSKGAISLEGGFQGAPAGPLGASLGTKDTLFQLVETFDGEIDCGSTETLSESASATFQVTRGFDTNGECKGPEDGLLFNFESGVEGDELFVDFVTEPVDSDTGTVAQFLEVITWTFQDPPNVPGGDAQHRTLSYDDHVGAGKRVMPWCLEDPRDGSGQLPEGSVDPSTILPAGHTSCLIESTSRVTGVADILDHPLGSWIKVDVVYNVGDGKRWN